MMNATAFASTAHNAMIIGSILAGDDFDVSDLFEDRDEPTMDVDSRTQRRFPMKRRKSTAFGMVTEYRRCSGRFGGDSATRHRRKDVRRRAVERAIRDEIADGIEDILLLRAGVAPSFFWGTGMEKRNEKKARHRADDGYGSRSLRAYDEDRRPRRNSRRRDDVDPGVVRQARTGAVTTVVKGNIDSPRERARSIQPEQFNARPRLSNAEIRARLGLPAKA